MLVGAKPLEHPRHRAGPGHPLRPIVLIEDLASGVGERQPKRRMARRDTKRGGGEDRLSAVG